MLIGVLAGGAALLFGGALVGLGLISYFSGSDGGGGGGGGTDESPSEDTSDGFHLRQRLLRLGHVREDEDSLN